MRALVTAALLIASFPLIAQTTNNNDSCDVGVFPAATLLLPYFEVDTTATAGTGTTTLFTITNTSRYPQIAHVTLWTDWAYPVLGFNIFLTGYDVQGINLYDVIQRALIVPGPPNGTSITTTPGSSTFTYFPPSSAPSSNTSNPNFVLSGDNDVRKSCDQLPGQYPTDLAIAVKDALTTGISGTLLGNCGSSRIGSNHGTRAVGYVTVDVVSTCTKQFPTDPGGTYFAGPTSPLLYDNVLLGDYQVIGPAPAKSGLSTTFDAEGNAMVHIRAMPEGGLSGAGGSEPVATNLPYTFYDRYTPAGARTADRRQPLPSLWAARYIEGSANNFETDLKIWREGITTGRPDCQGVNGAQMNGGIALINFIRFDEHENSSGSGACLTVSTCPSPRFSATSRTPTTNNVYPPLVGNDVGGWMYLNLSSDARGVDAASGNLSPCLPVLSAQRPGLGNCNGAAPGTAGSRTTSQNWVITSMFGPIGANRLSVDFDAAALGNGCTPAAAVNAVIAPASHVGGSLLCPPNAKPTDCSALTRPAAPNP